MSPRPHARLSRSSPPSRPLCSFHKSVRRPRLALTVEALEPRCLLTTFVVDDPIDLDDGTIGSGQLSLREAVRLSEETPGTDVITFDPRLEGTTLTLANGPLVLNDPVGTSIQGPVSGSLTISGGGNGRVLEILDGATVILEDLQLVDGSTTGNGGAVHNSGNLTIRRSVISDSTAGDNDADGVSGGGLFNAGSVVLDNTTISGNSSFAAGGGVANQGFATIIDSQIAGNRGGSEADGARGGGIINTGQLTIHSSQIVDNTLAQINYAGDGGGIFNSGSLTMSNGTVVGNSNRAAMEGSILAGGYGGGIANTGFLSLNSVTIQGNSAEGGESDGLAFRDINLSGQGGGISNVSGTVEIVNSLISENRTRYAGGGIRNFSGQMTLIDTRVSGNTAGFTFGGRSAGFGGGISNSGLITIDRSTIQGNSAGPTIFTLDADYGYAERASLRGGRGGGIYNGRDGSLSVTDSVVDKNLAGTDDANPHAFYELEAGYGGGIFSQGDLTITSSSIVSNTASLDGGAIRQFRGITLLINGTLSSNDAGRDGGAISLEQGSLEIANTTITANRADTDDLDSAVGGGGGIRTDDAPGSSIPPQLILVNSIVSGNLRGQEGSESPNNLDGQTPELESRYNLVGSGPTSPSHPSNRNGIDDPQLGPLQNNGGSTPTHAPLSTSPALEAGPNDPLIGPEQEVLPFDQRGPGFPRLSGDRLDIGAVELIPETPGLFVDIIGDRVNVFDHQTSLREAVAFAKENAGPDTIRFAETLAGATIILDGSPIVLDDSEGITLEGPGVDLLTLSGDARSRVLLVEQDSVATLSGLTIEGGYSDDHGGGIRNRGDLDLISVSVINNHVIGAGRDGGGISNVGTLEINNVSIRDNRSEDDGGGLFNDGLLIMTDSEVIDNISQGSGGGLENRDVAILRNVEIVGNTSGQGGGVVNAFGDSSLTIDRSTIRENRALLGGGGLMNNGTDLILIRSVVAENRSDRNGAGLLNRDGQTQLVASTIHDNTAITQGGAIDISRGAVALVNATLSGNRSGSIGGAISNRDGTLSLDQSTLTNNSAEGRGGAIWNAETADSTVRLTNSIVAGNWQGPEPTPSNLDGKAPEPNSRGNVIGSGPISLDSTKNLVGLDDPGLGPLESQGGLTPTHALLSGSPAILAAEIQARPRDIFDLDDDGDRDEVLPVDQRGVPFENAAGAFQIVPTTLRVASVIHDEGGVQVAFTRPLDVSAVDLYANNSPDLILEGPDGPVLGSLVVAPDGRSLHFIATGEILAPGLYTLTLPADPGGLLDLEGRALDGNGDDVSGDTFTTSFLVDNPGTIATLSLPDIVRGPDQAIDLPVGSNGLPITIENAEGATQIAFTIAYDPARLQVTGGQLGSSLPDGSSLVIDTTTLGTVDIEVTIAPGQGLAGDALELVRLSATVPEDAVLTGKHILDIQDVVIQNDGVPVEAQARDAIHLVAYPGDAFVADQSYSVEDVSALLGASIGIPLADFPNVDPVLLTDINGNRIVDLDDAVPILQAILGIPTAQVPPRPAVDPPIPAGLDPRIAIGHVQAQPGANVETPLTLFNTDVVRVGVQTFQAVITFDPELVTVHDVVPGDLGRAYTMHWHADEALGQLIVVGYRAQPLELDPGEGGAMAWIDLDVADTLVPGDRVGLNLRSDVATSMGTIATGLNGGDLILIPAPTNRGDDPVDGMLTVVDDVEGLSTSTRRVQTLDSTEIPLDELNRLFSPFQLGLVLPSQTTLAWTWVAIEEEDDDLNKPFARLT